MGSGWGAHAARVFASDDRIQLCGLVGTGSSRSEALAKELNVPLFTELSAAIAGVSPQVASVAVHETRNVMLVEQLLARGCHVLCSHPVATAADDVARLAALARSQQVLAATDYSLRLCPAYAAARDELSRSGTLLRVTIESPSRTMVIAIDMALDLAGPAERAFVAARYPAELKERRSRHPKAFAPTVLLEHRSGVVTTIVPVPQADPAHAYRLVLSSERASIRLALPDGGARRVQYLGKGEVQERELAPTDAVRRPPVELYGAPMKTLVSKFVDAVVHGGGVHAPFGAEVSVRATWEAFDRSVAEQRPAEVRAP